MSTSTVGLGRHDLVFCSGTLFGRSLRDKVEAAAAGGFRGLTLWPEDVEGARAEGLSDEDVRGMLADHGLVVADLDPLLGWTREALPAPGEARVPLAPEATFYEMAEAFGARSLNVAQGFGARLDLDAAAEDLAGVCDRAREHGLLVTVEFLPWSGIPDAATAWDLIQRTGRPNATLLVDSWHWFRGGADLERLRAVPGDRIGSVQLSDAPARPADDVVEETMRARRLPGEGDIPLAELVALLDEIGSDAPLGVEVFSADHDARPASEVGRRCAEATREVLARARPPSG